MPTLDPQAAALLDRLAADGGGDDIADDGLSDDESRLAQLRAPWPAEDPALLAPQPLPDVAELVVPGDPPVPVRVFTSPGARPAPWLLWLHPGGFVAGRVADIDGVCRALAADARCTVVSVEYRLAPEAPFPAALDDVDTALAWLYAHAAAFGLASDRYAIGGQSAGATLAAGLALRLRDEGRAAPALQVLAYPALDPALAAPSYVENDGVLFTTAGFAWDWDRYLGERRAAPPPQAAPLYAKSLAGVAPVLLLAAGNDPARDDSRRYHARLTDAGVESELVEYPGTIHAFLSFAGALDVAQEALALIACRLRACLAPETPALHHVGLPYSPGRAADARTFYGGLLGLKEQPLPAALADRPFLWFALGDGAELHLIPEAVAPVQSERHVCLSTSRLNEIADRLHRAGHIVERYEAVVNRPQAFVHDPFGNLLELTEIRGAYA
jgi:acetyl esterase